MIFLDYSQILVADNFFLETIAIRTSQGIDVFVFLYICFFVCFIHVDIGSNLGTFSLMAAAMGRNAVAVDAVYYNLAHIFAR